MRVTTKGFQILKDKYTFEFPQGITVLQGESANGKSSLFYAIQYCLLNPSGVDYCINWDCKQAEVTIENNGNSITWIKTPTSSTYIDNTTGKEYVKASKLDSRDIADLGFCFDRKDHIINLHDEWCLIFPFGLSDTEMFKQFEEIFNITSSYQIVDEIKKDEQRIKTETTTIKQQIDQLTQNKVVLDSIIDKIDIKEIDEYIGRVDSLQNKVNQIQTDITTLTNNSFYKNIKVPCLFDYTSLMENGRYLNEFTNDFNIYLSNQKRNSMELPEEKIFNFEQPEIIGDYDLYIQNTNTIKEINQSLENIEQEEMRVKEQLKEIKVCPTCGRPF